MNKKLYFLFCILISGNLYSVLWYFPSDNSRPQPYVPGYPKANEAYYDPELKGFYCDGKRVPFDSRWESRTSTRYFFENDGCRIDYDPRGSKREDWPFLIDDFAKIVPVEDFYSGEEKSRCSHAAEMLVRFHVLSSNCEKERELIKLLAAKCVERYREFYYQHPDIGK